MAQILEVPVIDHRMFHVQREGGKTIFSQEISSLNRKSLFKQIYPDACDVGFAIRGKQETLTFCFVEEDAGDNEIAGWRGELIPEDRRRFPNLNVEVLVIND